METFTKELLTKRLQVYQNLDFKWTNLSGHVFDKLRKSAILVPLVVEEGEVYIFLSKRSDRLRDEAGTVSFPGGAKDISDEDEVETCLRESAEEVGLEPKDIDIVSQFLPWINKREATDMLVTPVVGILSNSFTPRLNHDEVEFTFRLPLRRFLTRERHASMKYTYKEVTFSINFFSDIVGGIPVTTWGLTAGVCVHVAICVFQQLPSYKWASGYPLPQLHDPFMDLKHFLAGLEKAYGQEKSKL